MVLSETDLNKIEEVPTEQISLDLAGGETDLEIEGAEIVMDQTHPGGWSRKDGPRLRIRT